MHRSELAPTKARPVSFSISIHNLDHYSDVAARHGMRLDVPGSEDARHFHYTGNHPHPELDGYVRVLLTSESPIEDFWELLRSAAK